MNRNNLVLAASAIALGAAFIATAYAIACDMDYKPGPINVARATDRELLECFQTGDWTQAFAELKRRAAGHNYKESTDLAFEVLSVGFRVRPDRHIRTGFFEYSVAFLPKPLADWVQVEGPRRREEFANSVFAYLENQRRRAQSGQPVDLEVLEQLYADLKTPDRYPLFWDPEDTMCGLSQTLPDQLKEQIRSILESVPGGAEARQRLGLVAVSISTPASLPPRPLRKLAPPIPPV